MHTSPLSIPHISITLHERLDGLDLKKVSNSKSLSYHYGPRYFKCGVLGCYYRRYGFETKRGRRAHEKNHQKPWNCNFPGCRFATQGFISRRMRDDHLKHGHSHDVDPGLSSTTLPQKIEDEELQPLVFDLIETNKLEIITLLMPSLHNLERFVQMEIAIHAAKMGSTTILQLLNDSGLLTGAFFMKDELCWEKFSDLAEWTVASESMSLSKTLLCWVATLDLHKSNTEEFQPTIKNILLSVIVLESRDLFELWRPILVSGFGIAGTTMKVALAFTFPGTIATTDNKPARERMLLVIWEECKALDKMKKRERNQVLRSIADTSCSVNLARYGIRHGCEVDAKATETSPTALQFAARKTTQQAADLMKFLLLQGADPNLGTPKKMIRDEKGAREISKWLGLTWEELVERTREERQRNEKKGNKDSYSD